MTPSVDPADRTVRFSLRLTPDEMALVEKIQTARGGHKVIPLNTVIADLITGRYSDTIKPTKRTAQAAEWAAKVLQVTPELALEQLAVRGLPHNPGPACDHNPDGTKLPMPPAAVKAAARPPKAAGGWAPGAIGFARPVPSGLPPVQPSPNQIPMGGTE